MSSTLINGLFVFMLAAFIGFEVIRRVSPLLHTPLMSLTNALDAIAVVGAIVLVGRHESRLSTALGILAIVAATSNIVGGFLITDRMLKMFKAAARPSHKHSAVTHPAIQIIYLVASILFILSLKWMSSPSTARRGVWAGEIGMLLAIGGTLLHRGIVDYTGSRSRSFSAPHRGSSRPGADDRRPSTDGAEPRVWRALRRAGGHRRVLSASPDVSRSPWRSLRWR